MPLAYAVLVGVAPIVLAFIAGFFGLVIPLGWPAYIAWFIFCLVVGAIVTIAQRR